MGNIYILSELYAVHWIRQRKSFDIKSNSRTYDVKKWSVTNLHKCGMWNPNTDNQTLSPGVPQWSDNSKKSNFQGDIKTLLGRDREMEKDNEAP